MLESSMIDHIPLDSIPVLGIHKTTKQQFYIFAQLVIKPIMYDISSFIFFPIHTKAHKLSKFASSLGGDGQMQMSYFRCMYE